MPEAHAVLIRSVDMPETTAPIGMFDSGVGGLAVLAEVRRLLPAEGIIYYADTAFFPYGERTPDEILARSDDITRELLSKGAKLIVVACNTATSAAIIHLRETFDVSFVGTEPALKPAAERTETGSVALLTTPGTARGEKLAGLIDRHGRNVRVTVIEAPGLADAVEAGALAAPETFAMVRRYAHATREAGADVLALGCTHYAFLRAAFEREFNGEVAVIEPSEAIARQVARVLEDRNLRSPANNHGSPTFECSGEIGEFEAVKARLLEEEAIVR